MEIDPEKKDQNPFQKSQNFYRGTHILLRLLASLTTLGAALYMGFNKQSSDIAGFQVHASYKTSPAFKFFVIGNALVCAYSVLTLPFVSNLVDGYILALLDLVIMGLVMASASAATTIAYLGKNGNAQIGWIKVCPYYEKFCQRVGISLIFSYIGFLLFLLMCALSFLYKNRQNISA